MKRLKNLTYKHYVAIAFCAFIFICGILTITVNFREVFGGLVRGYMKMPSKSTVTERLSNSISTFDKRMNENFIFHDLAIDSYGGIQRIMDKHLIDDADPNYNVVKLNNDYLTFKANGNDDRTALMEYLLRINKTCNNVNSKLLFVNKLEKTTYDSELLPDYYPYQFSSNFDSVTAEMISKGIDVLDLNDMVAENGIDKYSLFYKTDHHWTTKTGVWVSNCIAHKINEYYQIDFDFAKLSIENITVESHKSSFLGSQGTRTGSWYTSLDDFDYIYPNYPTNMDYVVRNKNISLSGSFLDTILYQKDYKEGYHAYMPATYDLTTITNHESNNGKYAVFVTDSFGGVVAPFLSQTFQRTDCVDLRYFSDNLEEYIQTNKPDVVIYMVDWTDAVLHQDVI